MDTLLIQPNEQIQYLKEKCNTLVDLTMELQTAYERLKNENDFLQNENQNLVNSLQESYEQLQKYPSELSSTFISFFVDFYTIAKKVYEDKAFIPYTYESKNARNYLKIEKGIFEQYITQNTDIPLKNFKEYCSQFFLIKSEDNRKFVFSSDKIQIYYVNKAVIGCLLNDFDTGGN